MRPMSAISLKKCFAPGPLSKSHNIRRKGAVRYDFLFVRDSYEIKSLVYNYDDAVASGSDHAIIVGEVTIQ